MRMVNLPNDCYGDIIVSLAHSSSLFWAYLAEAREHAVCRDQTLVDIFTPRILAPLDVERRREVDIPPNPAVTIIDRPC